MIYVRIRYCFSSEKLTNYHSLLPGRVFVFPSEGPHLERPQGDGGATYVNIPVSPTSKKQLNYMELQEPGSRMSASHPSCQSKNASRLPLGSLHRAASSKTYSSGCFAASEALQWELITSVLLDSLTDFFSDRSCVLQQLIVRGWICLMV